MKTNLEITCRLICDTDVLPVAKLFSSAVVSIESEIDRTLERIGNERLGALVAMRNDTVISALFFDATAKDCEKSLYLEQIFVSPEHRRQGVCSTMIDWIAKWALPFDYEYIYLLVNGSNKPAISCYLRNGFAVRDSRKTILDEDNPNILRMERYCASRKER